MDFCYFDHFKMIATEIRTYNKLKAIELHYHIFGINNITTEMKQYIENITKEEDIIER